MRTLLLYIATTALIGAQVAPALAQATADERHDRGQSIGDENGVRHDTAEIRDLNAKVRAVHLRMRKDHGAVLEADQKELAGLEAQEKSARSNEASLNAANRGVQKDYHQDLSQEHPH